MRFRNPNTSKIPIQMKIINNLYKYILTLGSFFLFFSSCSDELGVKSNVIDSNTDGKILLNIHIPTSSIIHTRETDGETDAEKEISESYNHYVLIFENTQITARLIQKKSLDSSEISEEHEVILDLKGIDTSSLNIIVVANVQEDDPLANLIAGNSSYGDLLQCVSQSLDKDTQPTSPFIMSGKAEASAIQTGEYDVNLERTAAKISITSSDENFYITDYAMFNSPSQGFYTAAIAGQDNYIYRNGSNTIQSISSSNEHQNYTYPVKSAGIEVLSPTGAYFIVKGDFQGETCYYRVDLRKETKNANGEFEYYDIDPNHWYQVEITSVNRKGYATVSEAAKHYMGQEGALTAIIHDHSVNVLSMVTDGYHELGTSRSIRIGNESTTSTTFVVRMACKEDEGKTCNHYPSLSDNSLGQLIEHKVGSNYSVKVIDGDSWIKLSSIKNITNSISEVYNGGNESITETPGQRWEYTIDFDKSKAIGGEMTGKILVTWEGLSREIDVIYKMEFSPDKITTPTILIIKEGGDTGTRYYTDYSYENSTKGYWSFLAGETTNFMISNGVPKFSNVTLLGIDEASMGSGKIRNQGFHFPMTYGDSPWQYEYRFCFMDQNQISAFKEFSVDVKIDGVSVPSYNSVWGTNKFLISKASTIVHTDSYSKVPLTRGQHYPITRDDYGLGFILERTSSANDYGYSIAELVITLYTGAEGDEGTEYKFNLYHTGFFHKVEDKFYYYEVVNLGGQYWLDRNLGATSSQMYINDGVSYPGRQDASGNFYKIANAGSSTNNLSWTYENLCPPGYTVPNATDWDKVRLSQNFTTTQITENGASFMATYFDTNDVHMGKIYFPKSRFYNQSSELEDGSAEKGLDEVNSGDNGAGYYWTSTESSGLEKDEIACWLQVLNLNGSANTYISGSIKHHMMNVRCIASQSHSSDQKNPINFNVKGATHVYLYTIDDKGNKNGLFSFPGKAIGTQGAVDNLDYGKTITDDEIQFTNEDSYLHFSYTSSVQEKDLYVFFTYVTTDGKITIISSNKDQTVKGATGWQVKKGYNYFFDAKSGTFQMDKRGPFKKGTSGDGTLINFRKGDIIDVYWPKNITRSDGVVCDLWRIYLRYPEGGNVTAAMPGDDKHQYYKNHGELGNVEAYRYQIKVSRDIEKYVMVLSQNGESDKQTGNIELTPENSSITVRNKKDGSPNEWEILVPASAITIK